MRKFECWEFHGRGDPFFGGNADDKILYRLCNGVMLFLRDSEWAMFPDREKATFPTNDEAIIAGRAASDRDGGLIAAFEVVC